MNKRATLIFIFITVMIDAIGIGIIMPVMPSLIEEVTGEGISAAARYGGYLMASFGIMQFIFGPIVGNLSDAYGRRPVFLVSLFALVVDYVITALASSIGVLFLARILGGITSATHSTANAVVADISDDSDRARNFGFVGAAFGVGFVLGPVIGGVLGEFGTRAPFYGAAIAAALNFLFGYFVFKETLPVDNRRKFSLKRANPLGALRRIFKVKGLAPFILVWLLYSVAFSVYPSIWSYFTQYRFEWSPGMIGISLAAFGIGMAVVQIAVTPRVVKKFGARMTVVIGFLVNMLSFILIAFVPTGGLLLAATPITSLGAVTGPALQDLTTRAVSKNAQGELQGILSSVQSLSTIISPLIMTQVFYQFTASHSRFDIPGAPFFLSFIFMVFALLVFRHYVKAIPRKDAAG